MMQKFKCHKVVEAAKIVGVHIHGDSDPAPGSVELRFDGDNNSLSFVRNDAEWAKKHKPKVGDYYVQYEDGYVSVSPAKAFEEGYEPLEEATQKLTFGQALGALNAKQKVARTGWNGKGLWLELQTPDAHSKMTLPYIFMSYPADAQNTPSARVPWLASQTDMLASDWLIVQ